MFLLGRLPMPQNRRGDLETRHSFSAQESGCETTSAEKRGKYVEENWLLGVRDLSRIFEFGRNVGNSASDCKWYRVVIYY